jgi:lipopolysaccharide transport system ATP-binding protein
MSAADRAVMLELDDVSHSYRSGKKTFEHGIHRVLDSVSLKLYEGETLGIIGRNGAGKTTMLQIMAKILAPSRGQVKIRPGKTSSLLTLGLGFRQDLSGRDNALLAAMLQGADLALAQGYLEEIKAFSELGDSFEEPVARLGFTTALLTHVDILLIDEVLSVGDRKFREKAEAAMKERVGGDQTVVFVSHSQGQVEALCDRAILIADGKVAAEGGCSEVLAAYGK